jgi:hypothetical protein
MGNTRAWPPSLADVLDACPGRISQEIAWCVGSAPLLSGTPLHWPSEASEEARLHFADWLKAATSGGFQDEIPVRETTRQRLGFRFENCLQTWFHHHPDWSVKAANHTIQLNRRTAGEIDLLIERENRLLHLELAVKFYLSTSASRQWNTWVGIDPVDRLDLKMAKFERQLELSQRPNVRRHLEEQGWLVADRHAWMKGWFFEHFSRISQPVLPQQAAPDCNVGWWCHERDWQRMWSNSGDWVALQPQHWLRIRHDETDVIDLRAPEALVLEPRRHRVRMVAMVNRGGGVCSEISRGIVVDDRWPTA